MLNYNQMDEERCLLVLHQKFTYYGLLSSILFAIYRPLTAQGACNLVEWDKKNKLLLDASSFGKLRQLIIYLSCRTLVLN